MVFGWLIGRHTGFVNLNAIVGLSIAVIGLVPKGFRSEMVSMCCRICELSDNATTTTPQWLALNNPEWRRRGRGGGPPVPGSTSPTASGNVPLIPGRGRTPTLSMQPCLPPGWWVTQNLVGPTMQTCNSMCGEAGGRIRRALHRPFRTSCAGEWIARVLRTRGDVNRSCQSATLLVRGAVAWIVLIALLAGTAWCCKFGVRV